MLKVVAASWADVAGAIGLVVTIAVEEGEPMAFTALAGSLVGSILVLVVVCWWMIGLWV